MLSSLGVAPVSEVLSSLSSVNSLTSDNSNTQTPDASLQANMNCVGLVIIHNMHLTITLLNVVGNSIILVCSGGKKQPLNLSVYNVQATNIPPKETLVYSKQTQTTNTGGHERDGGYYRYVIAIYFCCLMFPLMLKS